jgi:hypothetical protein
VLKAILGACSFCPCCAHSSCLRSSALFPSYVPSPCY